MSTLRNDQPANEEVRHEAGELRKPLDRHDQPEQGGAHWAPDDGHMRDLRRDPAAKPRTETAPGAAPGTGGVADR
jgi:hypothetical protein